MNQSICFLGGGRFGVIIDGRVDWRRHLANVIERSMRGGDAALYQITFATCISYGSGCLYLNRCVARVCCKSVRHWMAATIRYDRRCYFSVRSRADISQFNLLHGNRRVKSGKPENSKVKKRICSELLVNSLGNSWSQS